MKSKTSKSLHFPVIISCAALALVALTVLSGCKKSETTEPPKTEGTNAPAAASTASTGSSIVTATLQDGADIPQLSEELKTSFLSNTNSPLYERIAKINAASLTGTQKAQLFLAMLPGCNRDGQRELAHTASALVTDSAHSLVFKPLLDGQLDKQVLSIFMTDTLKRPSAVKLPELLELARMQDHPMQAEAKELLVALLGKDHGTKWAEWQVAVNASVANSTN